MSRGLTEARDPGVAVGQSQHRLSDARLLLGAGELGYRGCVKERGPEMHPSPSEATHTSKGTSRAASAASHRPHPWAAVPSSPACSSRTLSSCPAWPRALVARGAPGLPSTAPSRGQWHLQRNLPTCCCPWASWPSSWGRQDWKAEPGPRKAGGCPSSAPVGPCPCSGHKYSRHGQTTWPQLTTHSPPAPFSVGVPPPGGIIQVLVADLASLPQEAGAPGPSPGLPDGWQTPARRGQFWGSAR